MSVLHTLFILIDTSPTFPSLTPLFTKLTEWLLPTITVGGGFFLLIDMAKHLLATPRDLRAAGIDLVVFTILLALASQATKIAQAAAGLIQ
jgi:hypothetical protein